MHELCPQPYLDQNSFRPEPDLGHGHPISQEIIVRCPLISSQRRAHNLDVCDVERCLASLITTETSSQRSLAKHLNSRNLTMGKRRRKTRTHLKGAQPEEVSFNSKLGARERDH